MSQYQTRSTDEGEEIEVHSLQANNHDIQVQQNKAKIYLLLIISVGMVLYALADYNIVLLIATPVIAVVVYFWALPSLSRSANPIVDHKNRRIRNFDEQWIDYTAETEIVLSRTFEVEKLVHSERGGYRAKLNWTISLRSPQDERVLFSNTTRTGTSNDPRVSKIARYYLLKPRNYMLATLAEQLAEIAALPLVDETGTESIRREKGKTDISLVNYLKQEGTTKPYQQQVDQAVDREFEISQHGATYEIRDRDVITRYDALFGVIPVILVVMALLGYGIYFFVTLVDVLLAQIIFIGVFSLFEVLLLFFLGGFTNGIRSSFVVTINSDMIGYQDKGLFLINGDYAMPLPYLEKIVVFEAYNQFGVELVSDKLRIPLYGRFDEQEVIVLKNIIQQLIIAV